MVVDIRTLVDNSYHLDTACDGQIEHPMSPMRKTAVARLEFVAASAEL